MTAFRFPLEKVLAWRRTQLELEEMRFRVQAAMLADLDRRRAELEAFGIRTEMEVRGFSGIQGRDLEALQAYRERARSEKARLEAERADCSSKLATQQSLMLEARRRCRLLERLRERRLEEWKQARDGELEQAATESFLARWAREKE